MALCFPHLFVRKQVVAAAFVILAASGATAEQRLHPGPADAYPETAMDHDHASVQRATLGVILGTTAGVAWYGKTNWWQDGFEGRFKTRKEGWFGRNTYSGGADKLGHFHINYAGTRLFSRAFEWAGNGPEQSRMLAALLMLGTFTGIEVLDGYSRDWHFSREDALINAAGVGLGLLLEDNPRLDQLLDFRIHYRPSRGSGFDPFGDYSGQTYLLVLKAEGVPAWRDKPVLRYLEFAVGYGSRGYSRDTDGSSIRGQRNLYAGISLNFSLLLDEQVFGARWRNGRTRSITRNTLEYLQVPGTAAYGKRSLD